jgi:hypothetical protein
MGGRHTNHKYEMVNILAKKASPISDKQQFEPLMEQEFTFN